MTSKEFQQYSSVQSKAKKHSDLEHRIQSDCVTWFRLQYPQLALRLFAVPNGSNKSVAERGKMKAEGLLAGVADLILLKPNGIYGALLIEMKTEKKSSRQSVEQKKWETDLCKSDEYRYVVCRSLNDFIHEVKSYLNY